MATGKYKKKNRGTDDVNSRGAVHNIVVSMADDTTKNESNISTPVLFAAIVVCVVLIIAIPALAVMYVDMNNATNAAIIETRKMKELRLLILQGQ